MDKENKCILAVVALAFLLIIVGFYWSIKSLEAVCPNGQCRILTITTTN